MAIPPLSGPSADHERIVVGGLPHSTLERIASLGKWSGSTSFLTTDNLLAARELDVETVAQVVGASGCLLQEGVIRPLTPGLGRRRFGKARWLERSGPVKTWAVARRRALGRLTAQATLLRADAVVGIVAERRLLEEEEPTQAEVVMTGTAVRFRGRRRQADRPLLTLLTPRELLLLERAGLEASGIAGASANVRTLPSKETMLLVGRRSRRSAELPDLTKGAYEARRLAMHRLVADAGGLGGAGLIGVETTYDRHWTADHRGPSIDVTVHALATAVRRRRPGSLAPSPVVDLGGSA